MTRILWQHGLKNVSVNLFTIISLLVNRMLAATVVIEAVFAIPGMGSLIVRGAHPARFPDRAGRGVRHGDRGHRGQPDRRSALRRRRSEDRAMTDMRSPRRSRRAEPSRLRRLFRWLAGDLRAALAILVLLVLVIVAIGAPWIAPYAPTAQDVNNMLAPPGAGPSARHRRSRPRHLQPPDLRRAGHRLCQPARGRRRDPDRPAGRPRSPASSAAGPTTSSAGSSTRFCRFRPSCWRSRSPARSASGSPTA